ncbi:hypothetical protein F5Y15DRAFT_159926 [Xylariaceae sp. FL0016]|nr:hypothetical protein F5Y15DRAFT_159926 [Xylariaceae sp. FL0016]
MRALQVLPPLLMPVTVLALPTSGSPVTPIDTRDDISPTCTLAEYPITPTSPGDCWAWYTSDSEDASNYCDDSTFEPIPAETTASVAGTTAADWLSACTALHDAQLANKTDYLLASYVTASYNTLLTHDAGTDGAAGACALQLSPQTPPTSDQIYFGSKDLTEILASASAIAQEQGASGVGGQMACGGIQVAWRMVPV